MKRLAALLVALCAALTLSGGPQPVSALAIVGGTPSAHVDGLVTVDGAAIAVETADRLGAWQARLASWSCSTTAAYGNSRATSADCWTNTPTYTRGYVAARQTCATSTGQYTQYGNVRVATYHNGWTGVSTTPTCPGYVVARYYSSGYVPSAYP